MVATKSKAGNKDKKSMAAAPQAVTSVDLFAGAGGLSIGLHQAGVEVLCAVEYDKHAAKTFAHRFTKAKVFSQDVRTVDLSPYRGKVDIVCGGPPCQPFSSGGLRNAGDDERDMIPAFIDAVRTVAPRAFLMENVNGLTVGDRRVYLEAALEKLRALGYNLTWQVVNAADYGVPQIRKRLIVVGVREGVFEFPEPTHGTAVGQPHLSSGEVLATVISATTNTAKVTYARNPDTRPNPYHGQLYNGGGRPIDLEQPAPTILASAGGNKTHFLDLHGLVPTYHAHLGRGGAPQTGELPGARRLTIEESAALQTFPADMVFLGPQSSQYRQIGNAVPPGLARIIGDALVEHLAAHQPKKSLPQQQLQLFADTSSSNVAKSRSKEENPVYRAVTKVVESIDFFLGGGQLDGHALPPAPLRAAASNLVSQSKYSTSVRVACLYLVFYKMVNPEYTFDAIPTASRGAMGDKLLGASLKDRHIVLGDVTSCFENIGSKGDQGNFNLGTDARFRDFITAARQASQEEIEKTAMFLASLFAASQAVPPLLPALSDDTLSFVRAKALFKTLVATESGGFIQQFLVAALLTVLRAKQNIQVKTHNPNAADKYDRTAGDIEEFVEGALLRAYEVTVRPDWKNRLPDFRAKMDKAGLNKYIILASGVNEDEELREPAAMAIKLDPVQRDLAVVDIMDFLTVMAAELSAVELRAAINETYEFLVNPTLGGKQQYTTAYTDAVGAWLDTAAA